jgi:hypothetical protein
VYSFYVLICAYIAVLLSVKQNMHCYHVNFSQVNAQKTFIGL